MPKRKITRGFENGIDDEELQKEAPEMDYRDSINQGDADEAFQIYFRERNIAEVHRQTDIPKPTLYHWRKKYGWDDRIAKIEEKGRVKIDKSLVQMQEAHQKAYRFVQMRAFQELKEGKHVRCPICKKVIVECPYCKEEGVQTILPGKLEFKSVGEAANVLDTAIKGERLVAGLTTSNVGIAIIQSLSDEFSERLGIALGRLLDSGFITDYIITRIVNEFSQVMNETPITVGKLKSGKETVDAEYEEADE